MTKIDNINYSNWKNADAKRIAQSIDNDGIEGLSPHEVFQAVQKAINEKVTKTNMNELLGLSVNASRNSSKISRPKSAEFIKAMNYYNKQMNSSQRYSVTQLSYQNLETRLYNMEKGIDNAFNECTAYQDIFIMPRWYYRFYPYMHDMLTSFDIEEIRTRTSNDMASLNELKDKIQKVIEDANGETSHTTPQKTNYDIEVLAIKHLGMSYSDFASKYKNEINYCKTVTLASFNTMNETQAMVYSKLKKYAEEMLNITINEAHTVRWDTGEKQMDETIKASDDMYTISEFEYDNITEQGLAKIESGIMYKAFEEALIAKHQEYDPTHVETVNADRKKGTWKEWINGKLKIHTPSDDYNASGIKSR